MDGGESTTDFMLVYFLFGKNGDHIEGIGWVIKKLECVVACFCSSVKNSGLKTFNHVIL